MEKQSRHGPQSKKTVSVPKTQLGSWRTTRREKYKQNPTNPQAMDCVYQGGGALPWMCTSRDASLRLVSSCGLPRVGSCVESDMVPCGKTGEKQATPDHRIRDDIQQWVADLRAQAKTSLLLVFGHKLLLKHSPVHLPTFRQGSAHQSKTQGQDRQTEPVQLKAPNICRLYRVCQAVEDH